MSIELFALLATHALCNAKAETTIIMAQEVKFCIENFDRLKITLHPEYTVEEFSALDPSQRAKLSVEAYTYYRDWVSSNPERHAQLTSGAKLMVSAGL
jgi:hypothetical protein